MALTSWERRALALRVEALLRQADGLRDRLGQVALGIHTSGVPDEGQSRERLPREG